MASIVGLSSCVNAIAKDSILFKKNWEQFIQFLQFKNWQPANQEQNNNLKQTTCFNKRVFPNVEWTTQSLRRPAGGTERSLNCSGEAKFQLKNKFLAIITIKKTFKMCNEY